jgi:hypothetical protein
MSASQDTRNASQRLYDEKYRPKIEAPIKPLDVRQVVKTKGVNGNGIIIRHLQEFKGRKRQAKHLMWLPATIVRDEKVSQALLQASQRKAESLSKFSYP